MKKITALLAAMLMLSSAACSSNHNSSSVTSNSSEATTSATIPLAGPDSVKPLVNRMNDTERMSANLHEFTLLDEAKSDTDIKISLESESLAKYVEDADKWLAGLSESEKKEPLTQLIIQDVELNRAAAEKNPDEKIYGVWRINDIPYTCLINQAYAADMLNYDGGALDIVQNLYKDPANGEIVDLYLPIDETKFPNVDMRDSEAYQAWSETLEPIKETKHFESYDEYRVWADDYLEKKSEYHLISADHMKKIDRAIYDAIMNHTVEDAPFDMLAMYKDTIIYREDIDPIADYRSSWEMNDREGVEHIKDSVRELNLRDTETGIHFLAHIVLPPDYDENKSYPAFVLTDGVWRFGDTPALYRAMEEGKAQDVILVTLGLDYHYDSQDMGIRDDYLLLNCAGLDDFITDNLMPYLGEQFNIDFANSSLYGHSDGGAFTHYAAFNSDKYENQPFRNYIIGSPALWGLHHPEDSGDITDYKRDYDYFERNDTFTKNLFITGGKDEDPDYESSYENGEDSTLEGINSLKERLDEHGVTTAEVKLYDSHHYQYIPEMLVEFLCKYYPAQ